MLYIVSTPIGNLQDITLRAIETLKDCDYILAEDTRQSLKLLHHFAIEKRLVSFHEFNEAEKEESVINDLKQDKQIALISDAGTPLISDPGHRLITRCIQENIAFTAIPGACAVIAALSLSGLAPTPFQFAGFLPRKKGELITYLKGLLEYPGTTICYESPERLLKTLHALSELDRTRKVVVTREMTKKFETLYRGTAGELVQQLDEGRIKGELVLLIEGKQRATDAFIAVEPSAMYQLVMQFQKDEDCSLKTAIIEVAKTLDLPKNRVYMIVQQQRLAQQL